MPELSSEKPSQEELQSYLNEHWQEMRNEIDHFLDEFGIDCRNLYSKLYDSILESLYRLNDFPRENEFWLNTNKKPTLYKLDEFCRLKLKENSNDILALRTILALAIKHGSIEHNFTEIIRKLVEFKELNGELLVDIYLIGDITYGGEGEYVSELLTELNLKDEANSKLKNLAESKNEFVSNWATKVLEK